MHQVVRATGVFWASFIFIHPDLFSCNWFHTFSRNDHQSRWDKDLHPAPFQLWGIQDIPGQFWRFWPTTLDWGGFGWPCSFDIVLDTEHHSHGTTQYHDGHAKWWHLLKQCNYAGANPKRSKPRTVYIQVFRNIEIESPIAMLHRTQQEPLKPLL